MPKLKTTQEKWEKVDKKNGADVYATTLHYSTDTTLEVLDYFPIIFTKHKEFVEAMRSSSLTAGAVLLLPEDALLIKPKDA